ncbi:MAG: efflux transporter outer membrane subunit [Syntrophobacteraceae bacterium]
MRRFPVFAIAVLLTGCMVGPDYRRPAVDTPPSFQYEEKEARDTANTDWWKRFDDPVLDALIAEALANNKTVKIAAANIEQAAGVLMQTRAQLFPQVSYSGSATRQRLSQSTAIPLTPGISNPQSSFQLLAGANWEIDLWGRIRRLTEAAQASLFATEEARRGVILSLVASTATSYLQLLTLDNQLEIAERTLGTYGETVSQFELKFKHGQVSTMTVEQARSQYETAAAAIPPIKSQIVQTENAICILLGRNPGHIERGKPLSNLTLPTVPSGLPSQLLERRPDLAQAEQNLIAANAQIGAAKALYFPTISLTGALGTASSDLSNLFKGPARMWSYAGSFTGPIFTAGAIAGQVKQAEAGQKAALLFYENAIQSAFGDVENALSSYRESADQLQAQERLVKALREYARLARMLYDGGYTQYLTVLYAETQLFPAELNYAQVHGSVLASLVAIYQAMGGGWVNEADKLTEAPPAPAVKPQIQYSPSN